ncbi:MAG: helix-turn-helix domain-containing protein [Aquihabitans sp.]
MSDLQQQAKALGDPTRHRIFRLLADSNEPLSVSDLVEHVGHTHNAIRQHLTKLLAAGLVVETVAEPDGRGRPRLLYEVAGSADSRWGVVGPYERLATLLAEVLESGDDPVDVGRRAGRALTMRTEAHSNEDPALPLSMRTFIGEMVRQGFEPHPEDGQQGTDIALRACPFESAAVANPATVCGLHQGMIEGMAQSVGGLVIDELVIRRADGHDCHVHCHTVADGSTSA